MARNRTAEQRAITRDRTVEQQARADMSDVMAVMRRLVEGSDISYELQDMDEWQRLDDRYPQLDDVEMGYQD